ncbi:hypothetical protein TBK1r_60420 [Stieleria magnilauensis]|uniref:CcmD family protein n=2 Tax=Pirellulaceae TaxID=2691357 RepID=A0ABX5XZ16_9BACT|nr:hypothetical protein TBK1r_59640 [Planctomycetes bacterium TBK1r]QDV87015.1 hypothetical protein TBK1r_60420 [Planctomycetes bacterium TBK1r]
MLGQNNDPSELGFVKTVLAATYVAIGSMWIFFVRVFWAVLKRNDELRGENKKLRQQVETLEETNDDDQ